jgi:formiminotetrahydrofolate cyclodeaminase
LRHDSDELTAAIDRDAASYDAVLAAHKLPQGDAGEIHQRQAAVQAATRAASEVPMEVAERTVALFERLGQLNAIVAASMKSDLEVARGMAAAVARGAMANVEINVDGISDSAYVEQMRAKIAGLRKRLGNAPGTPTA